jgi:hypothetical protein
MNPVNEVHTSPNPWAHSPFQPKVARRELLVRGRRRAWIAMLVSVIAAEVGATFAIVALRSPEVGLLCLAAGIASAWRWVRSHQKQMEKRAHERLRAAQWFLASQRYTEAWAAAKDAAIAGCGVRVRNAALTTLAWTALGEGEPWRAGEVLRQVLPADEVDPYTMAAVESARGYSGRAIATLERAKRTTQLGRDALRFLVDLHAGEGDYQAVTSIAHEFANVLGLDDVRRVALALDRAGEPELAAALAAAVPLGTIGMPPRSCTSLHGTR